MRRKALRAMLCVSVLAAAVLLFAACGQDDQGDRAVTVTQTTTVEPVAATQPAPAKPDPRPQPIEAAEYVENFYRLIDSYSYRAAWPLLPQSVRAEAGSFEEWRRGYHANIRSIPHNVRVISSPASAVVIRVEIEAKDIDACTGRGVVQTFAGTWSFNRAGDEWTPQSIGMEKTSGETPRIFASECPSADGAAYGGGGGYGGGNGYHGGGGGSGYGGASDGGYYEQLHPTPGGDGTIDCDQVGATDIYVGPSDPNGLDGDGDGYACEG